VNYETDEGIPKESALKTLIVDDDSTNRLLLQRFVKDCGTPHDLVCLNIMS